MEIISKEELERARRIFEEQEKIEEKRLRIFWSETYPSYTNDEKAKYWAGGLHQLMRSNKEYGFDEELVIAGQYESLKKDEPKIDELLEGIAKYLRYSPELFIRILKEGK